MCTPWNTKRFGSPVNATIPLHRRMFGPSVWVSWLIQGMNLLGRVALVAHGDRLHELVVIVLQAMPVMMFMVAILVVVIMVMIVDDQEFRLDVEDAVEIKARRSSTASSATSHLLDRWRRA